jgi:hypothetical protein
MEKESNNAEIDSDTESIMTSVTDISIYHEMDQVIADLHSLQQLQSQMIDQFQSLSSSFTSTNNNDILYIKYNNEKYDFDDLLDKVSKRSKEEMEAGGKMRLGDLLMEVVSEMIIQ